MRTLRSDIEEKLKHAIGALESDKPLSKQEKHKIADQLKESEQEFKKFRTWIELSQQLANLGVWEHDHQNDEVFWSDETFRLYDYQPQEVEPSYAAFLKKVHPEDTDRVDQAFKKSLENQQPYDIVYRVNSSENGSKFVEAHGIHFYDNDGNPLLSVGSNQNVTRRELEKREIQQSLEENRTLLGEIHHRVKNNLAVVSGMLQLQGLHENDPKLTKKLQDSASRIKTIAGIHQQLYQSDEFADIELGENIAKLASDLIDSMETDTNIELNTNYESNPALFADSQRSGYKHH